MNKLIKIPTVKNITVSGRIGSGQTTLATKLADALGWKLLEGGELFGKFHKKMNDPNELDVNRRPDDFDLSYEKMVQEILTNQSYNIIQSHLAGFDAQNIPMIFKILVTCEDEQGFDKTEVRIDRLVNRRAVSVDQAKHEIINRETANLEKWRRLYAQNDPSWVYWDKKYYDLVINTYKNNSEESLEIALEAIGYKK